MHTVTLILVWFQCVCLCTKSRGNQQDLVQGCSECLGYQAGTHMSVLKVDGVDYNIVSLHKIVQKETKFCSMLDQWTYILTNRLLKPFISKSYAYDCSCIILTFALFQYRNYHYIHNCSILTLLYILMTALLALTVHLVWLYLLSLPLKVTGYTFFSLARRKATAQAYPHAASHCSSLTS